MNLWIHCMPRGRVWLTCLGWLVLIWCTGCAGAKQSEAAAARAPGAAPMPQAAYGGEAALYADDAQEEVAADSDRRTAQAPAAGVPGRAPPVAPPASGNEGTAASGSLPARDPKTLAAPLLIYSANLQLAVFEAPQALDRAEQLAKEAGGYLVRRDDRTIVVRVPAAGFHGLLDRMLGLGDVLHRNVSVRDVTEEFYDLQIRIRNAELVRERLEQLLQRAQKVEEALAVERELERVAGEVERLKGRMKLLSELLAFSTITLEFQPRAVQHVESSVNLPFPWLQQLGLGPLLSL
ncbi:MAG TPA: DUF4349 domain-containing protein [Polyangiaceae bacterium]|nr:DUF4349 domain-containing protein [Polyangiaceae bacterium]